MKIDLPYYSQYVDISDPKWRSHSCPVACLGMVLEYFKENDLAEVSLPSLDDLLIEGFELRGSAEYGWSHDAIVLMAHNHGLLAYKEEFKSLLPAIEAVLRQRGVSKISGILKEGRPVIASVRRKWESDGSFHTIVLTGVQEGKREAEGFYYSDPDSFGLKEGKDLYVPLELFLSRWRGLAIFLYSPEDEEV